MTENSFEDYLVDRGDGLEGQIERFLVDLTLGQYKEHDISIVRDIMDSIENILSKQGFELCDPYYFYDDVNGDRTPCYEEMDEAREDFYCKCKECPFRKKEGTNGPVAQ